MPSNVFSAAAVRRALVIKLRHHGDVLLASPVISTLHRLAPGCEIDALVYSDTAPMLALHPQVAQLHVIDRQWKKQCIWRQLIAEGRLLAQLRARHYDLVIHLSIHKRGAWLTRLLRPRWSVAPRLNRQGKDYFWTRSFTHFYPGQSHPDRHTIESNLDSLRALGLAPTTPDKRVILVPGTSAEARIDALMAAHSLISGKFIHIHPTSRWLFKCWPAERVAELCQLLNSKGWPIVLTAAPDAQEMTMIQTILANRALSPALNPKSLIDLSGQLALKEMAALTSRAKLFVGVDSAPMHIAAAMDTPTVAIFGPSGDREWGPWQVAQRIVTSSNHVCRPCGRAGCNDSKISECLTTLPVAKVMAACEDLL
ncbi:MAG: putative lipopolysaccharide heptosyltransferase III [Rugosibacter sp.]|nr:putative lipopolysaccharide heptosyltransferase III [Rugosibacter sp.]